MIEIYTPEQWLSAFGGTPKLIIDSGYIYSRDSYYGMSRSPIGRINFDSGYIYGRDYNSILATPLAVMKKSSDVTEIYKYGGGLMDAPMLYIKNGKFYTPDQYFRVFGGTPSGYIKGDDGRTSGGTKTKNTESAEYSAGGSGGGGCLPSVLGVGILAGFIYIISDEGRLASSTLWLALLVNAAALVFFLWKAGKDGLHFAFSMKRLGMGLGVGLAVYIGCLAVFVLLGLVSNLGSGHAISDPGGDTMELAAILIGLPFLVNAFLAEGGKTN